MRWSALFSHVTATTEVCQRVVLRGLLVGISYVCRSRARPVIKSLII